MWEENFSSRKLFSPGSWAHERAGQSPGSGLGGGFLRSAFNSGGGFALGTLSPQHLDIGPLTRREGVSLRPLPNLACVSLSPKIWARAGPGPLGHIVKVGGL